MSNTPTLADAEARRDEALACVSAAASEEWKKRAHAAIIEVADRLGKFTADDLWDAGLDKPVEPRALGPVLRKAARDGYILNTGNYRKSRYRNATPLPVWADAALPGVEVAA